jgi:DNA-binding NtrC family response regulator
MILNEDNLLRNGKILVADDDLFYRHLLTNFLIGAEFSVTAVSGFKEAGIHLGRDSYDLCVFDFFLPGGSLRSIIESINRSVRPTPFIIMTGDESCETEREARSFNPVFFFVKPFSLSDFGSVIREVISRSSGTVAAVCHEWSVHNE